jgi:hypothetical protein
VREGGCGEGVIHSEAGAGLLGIFFLRLEGGKIQIHFHMIHVHFSRFTLCIIVLS